MKAELPAINQRVKEIVDHYSNGNVSKFVRVLLDNGQEISQQKFNRLFNIDTRTSKYPGVSTDVITAITEVFPEVNHSWLLTGEGQMLNKETVTTKPGDEINLALALELAILDDYVSWKSKETGVDYKALKAAVFEKARLIMRNFDILPLKSQFEGLL